MSQQTIGQAWIGINPDVSKTGGAVSAAMGVVGKQAGATLTQGIAGGVASGTSAVGASMSKFGSVIRQGTGEAIGQVAMLQSHFEGLGRTIKENGVLSAAGMASIGTGVAGAGLALMALGSAEKQSGAQLSAAITATGQSIDDYKGKIEEAVTSDEHLGHSTAETNRALQILVTITQNTGKSIDLMSTAADLAAARHISLSAAATQVGKAAEGNMRLFKMYGIEVKTNADGTKDLDGAMAELSKRLAGQGAASVSGFTGHLKVLGTEVEDSVAKFGQKYGPAITAAGSAMVLASVGAQSLGKLVDMLRGSTEASTAATEADIAVTEASTTALGADTAAATAAATAEGELALADSAVTAAESAAGVAAEQLALFQTEAGVAAEQLSLFQMEVAASSEAATAAMVEEGVAAKGSLIGMAAGAGIVGVALVGAGLLINHFMNEGKKQAEEGKKAFDAFWASVTANRNANLISDQTAEIDDLTKKIAAMNAERIKAGTLPDSNIMRMDTTKNIAELKALDKQLEESKARLKLMTNNVDDLSDHFQMNKQAVQDLAVANHIDLTGSYDGLQSSFEKVLGGTQEQIVQLAALEQQYGLTESAVKAFATSSHNSLSGTEQSTAAFAAAANEARNTGTTVLNIRDDMDVLTSSVSTVTEKLSAFKDMMDQIIGNNISAAQAVDNETLAILNLGSALDKHTHSLDSNTVAGIGNKKAIEDVIQKGLDAVDVTYKQTGSLDAANAAYDTFYQRLLAAAAAQGISRASLDTLLGSLGALPTQVTSALSGSGAAGSSAGGAVATGMAGAIRAGASAVSAAAFSLVPNADVGGSRIASGGGGAVGTPFDVAHHGGSLSAAMFAGGQSAGASSAQGIVAGIMSGANAVRAAATAIAQIANNAYKATLQTHSPSRVTHAIGLDVSKGLALGMLAGASHVSAAANQVGAIAYSMSLGMGMGTKSATAAAPPAGDRGIEFRGKWYSINEWKAQGDALLAAGSGGGGSAVGGTTPIGVSSSGAPGLTASDLTPIAALLQAISDKLSGQPFVPAILQSINDKVAIEIDATNRVVAAVNSGDNSLAALGRELQAGRR